MKAEDVLTKLIRIITINLEELNCYKPKNQFVYGEKTAYIECLEIIQSWDNSNKHKLDYNVQQRYL